MAKWVMHRAIGLGDRRLHTALRLCRYKLKSRIARLYAGARVQHIYNEAIEIMKNLIAESCMYEATTHRHSHR